MMNNKTQQFLRALISKHEEDFRTIRRDLHRHPELSGDERWTSTYIARYLEQLGIKVRTRVGGFGVVADLVIDPKKPTVALRVDMDALPIHEINQVPYRSQINDVMHACGHDVHSAIGIGTATVLTEISEHLLGNVRFIFQPEEEEITGALRMIKAGVLHNPTPIAIFGLHVAPLPVGKIAWTDDLFLAGFDHYLFSLLPKNNTDLDSQDLDIIAQHCVNKIMKLNKWQLPTTWQQMQMFWQLMGEGPDSLKKFIVFDASMNEREPENWRGSFGLGITAANPNLRRAALGQVKAIINPICRAAGTHYQVEHAGSMIDMRNNPKLIQATLPALADAVGVYNLLQLKAAFPFNCEDFAFYTQHIPGAMYWIGAANPKQAQYALLHTPDFDVDEKCINVGITVMTSLIIETLSQTKA